MLGITEEIRTFGDAMKSQGDITKENPDYKGDISFRTIQIAGGYLKGSGKPCEGCKHILRNTHGEVALIFISSGRVIPSKSDERSRGIASLNNYIVCGVSCNDPITPEEYTPEEQLGLPLVDLDTITSCNNREEFN